MKKKFIVLISYLALCGSSYADQQCKVTSNGVDIISTSKYSSSSSCLTDPNFSEKMICSNIDASLSQFPKGKVYPYSITFGSSSIGKGNCGTAAATKNIACPSVASMSGSITVFNSSEWNRNNIVPTLTTNANYEGLLSCRYDWDAPSPLTLKGPAGASSCPRNDPRFTTPKGPTGWGGGISSSNLPGCIGTITHKNAGATICEYKTGSGSRCAPNSMTTLTTPPPAGKKCTATPTGFKCI